MRLHCLEDDFSSENRDGRGKNRSERGKMKAFANANQKKSTREGSVELGEPMKATASHGQVKGG
jgi:hypothetical protein